MKNLSVLFSLLIFISSCSVSADEKETKKAIEKPRASNECPKGFHTDSIIPVMYGYPSEEMFQKADSGLLVLGGCELPEKEMNYYCKIHRIQFE